VDFYIVAITLYTVTVWYISVSSKVELLGRVHPNKNGGHQNVSAKAKISYATECLNKHYTAQM